MYDVNGDISFDDYAISVDENYVFNDFDDVELQQNPEENKETDIKFE